MIGNSGSFDGAPIADGGEFVGLLRGRPGTTVLLPPDRSTDVVRLLIVEAAEVYRLGLRAVLLRAADLAVVGEGVDLDRALTLARQLRPDVVLLGSLDDEGETAVVVRYFAVAGFQVLVLADHPDPEAVVDALVAGARGYLPKATPPDRLVEGIRAVAHGGTPLDDGRAGHSRPSLPDAAQERPPPRAIGADPAPATPTPAALTLLTDRQQAVAMLVADGLSNAEIAVRLTLREATVKSHVTTVFRRLGLRDRTQLAVLVHRRDPEPRMS